MSKDKKVKHSPGPWAIHHGIGQNVYIYGANTVCQITNPSGFYRSPKESEANAHLIAAAPELLEALKWFIEADANGEIEQGIYSTRGLYAARAAIAKAEGV